MNRTQMLSVRVGSEEKAALLSLAQQERLTASEMTRELIRSTARERGLWPPAQNTQREAQSDE